MGIFQPAMLVSQRVPSLKRTAKAPFFFETKCLAAIVMCYCWESFGDRKPSLKLTAFQPPKNGWDRKTEDDLAASCFGILPFCQVGNLIRCVVSKVFFIFSTRIPWGNGLQFDDCAYFWTEWLLNHQLDNHGGLVQIIFPSFHGWTCSTGWRKTTN